MNLYTGGPRRNAERTTTNNISFQPIAKTGSQAILLANNAHITAVRSFFMGLDSISRIEDANLSK